MMAYTIKIQNIYKGDDIKEGTIILITESVLGWSETEYGPISDDVSEYTTEEKNKFAFGLGSGTTCMFFCNIRKSNLSNMPKTKTDNAIILEPICNTKNNYFGYYNVIKVVDNIILENEYIEGFGMKFMRNGKYVNNRLVWDEETSVWEKLDNYLKEIGLTPKKDTVKKKM